MTVLYRPWTLPHYGPPNPGARVVVSRGMSDPQAARAPWRHPGDAFCPEPRRQIFRSVARIGTSPCSRNDMAMPRQLTAMVFDLDGTFADIYENEAERIRWADHDRYLHGNIQAFVNFRHRAGAHLIYASARTLSSLQRLQEELQLRGITLPTPDFYIANNGNFLYKNINGQLVADEAYTAELLSRTHFDREAIYATLRELGSQPRYRLPDGTRDQPAPDGTSHRLTDFAESQLAYYEFFPTASFVELMYAPQAHATLAHDLADALRALGVVSTLTWKKFPAGNLDWIATEAVKRPELHQILRLARPTRLDADGGLYTVHISAAQKRTAVEYLMDALQIPPNELVAAGNDMNDLSLAEMARDLGTWFVAVGNASDDFRAAVGAILDDLYRRGNAWHERLIAMRDAEGNESLRHAMNIILSRIHDAKVAHYRAAIDRIVAGQPQGPVEAAVMAEFRGPAVQTALAEDTARMMPTMPDQWPEALCAVVATQTATDKAVISLLERYIA